VHLTVASLMEVRPLPGLVVVPFTGLPPLIVAATWSAANDNPGVAAFASIAADVGTESKWCQS
jgi:hypothetical protein